MPVGYASYDKEINITSIRDTASKWSFVYLAKITSKETKYLAYNVDREKYSDLFRINVPNSIK